MKKLLTAIILAGGLFLVGCNQPTAVPVVRELPAERVAQAGEITVRGVVESVESRNVYSMLGLFVDRVYVEAGDEVYAGQVLAVLDTEDLELMIAQQRLELEMMRAMAEIIPPQRESELAAMRRMANLAPAQQQSELTVMRQVNQTTLEQGRRMYEEAASNLANNTNMHIIQAEANLTAAQLNLTTTRRHYQTARAEYEARNNPHLLGAESMLTSARLQLETMEADQERFQRLYEAGGLSRNDLRQFETALTHARNAYTDATTNLTSTAEAERRALEHAETALYAAEAMYRDAQTLLETTRLATQQELDFLRDNLQTAQIAANLEPMEIAINMSNIETTTNLEALEHAINLELTQLRTNLQLLELAVQLTESQLQDSILTAPISGTITAAPTTEGAIAAGLMFTIQDTQNLRIITSFREYEITQIAQGMEVTIRTESPNAPSHTGTIRRINPAANPFSPIVEFEAEIAITSQDTGLKIGMNTRITI